MQVLQVLSLIDAVKAFSELSVMLHLFRNIFDIHQRINYFAVTRICGDSIISQEDYFQPGLTNATETVILSNWRICSDVSVGWATVSFGSGDH